MGGHGGRRLEAGSSSGPQCGMTIAMLKPIASNLCISSFSCDPYPYPSYASPIIPGMEDKKKMVIMGFCEESTAIIYGLSQLGARKIRPWPHFYWIVPNCDYCASPRQELREHHRPEQKQMKSDHTRKTTLGRNPGKLQIHQGQSHPKKQNSGFRSVNTQQTNITRARFA
ncbi:MAG: hypothetical protein BYD32DRAFT_435644 [Podila humilis]|nr:MAG: hypothetical protein BYD32DRAFT_435644 [Podila humilis]